MKILGKKRSTRGSILQMTDPVVLPRISIIFETGEKYRKVHTKEYGSSVEQILQAVDVDIKHLKDHVYIAISGATPEEVEELCKALEDRGIAELESKK